MVPLFHKYWWTFLLRGFFLAGIGMAFLVYLNISKVPGGYFFTAYLFIEGILTLIPVFGKAKIGDALTFFIKGSTNLALGMCYFLWPTLIAFIWPELAMSFRMVFIAAWAMLTGCMGIFEFFQIQKDRSERWTLLFSSVLAIGFAILLYFRLNLEMMTLYWMTAYFAVIFGVLLVVFGIQCKYGLSSSK
jgi:uncharacterized membrane protein HdeD (DUF308 family)